MIWHQFNLEHGSFLWALLVLPLPWLLSLCREKKTHAARLENFADKHLLPHLLKKDADDARTSQHGLYWWSLIWFLGAFALAGPRWDFTEIPAFKPPRNLVIALDLSKSMDAEDAKPSRLALARQRIQDILQVSEGVNIGLVAFAADAHLVTPITEDKRSVLHLLGSLRTDLISIPGSRLAPVLQLASQMLAAVPGHDKSILVMTDGGLEDVSTASELKKLAAEGMRISFMGFGSLEGAPVPRAEGGFINDSGQVVLSKLNKDELIGLSELGNGAYFSSDFAEVDASFFDKLFGLESAKEQTTQTTRDWEPRFYFLLFPLLVLLLPLFRRRIVKAPLVWVLAVLLASNVARADEEASGLRRFFQNQEMQGKQALLNGDYATAIEKFQDPYRRGVAQYRAGQFAEAEQSFRASKRPSVSLDSQYDLGNALAREGKYQDAIQAYENVLKQKPDHAPAAANLAEVQKQLEKQQQQQNSSSDPNQKKEDGKPSQNDQQMKNGQQGSSGQKNGEKQNASADQKSGTKGQKKEGKGKPGNEVKKDASQQPGDDQKKQVNDSPDQKKEGTAPPSQTAQKGEPSRTPPPGDGTLPNSVDESGTRDTQRVAKKTPLDADADQWLNRIQSDSHEYLKNQFMIESARQKTRKGDRSW